MRGAGTASSVTRVAGLRLQRSTGWGRTAGDRWLLSSILSRNLWPSLWTITSSSQVHCLIFHSNKVSLLGGRGRGNMKEIQLFKDEKWVSFGEMKDARYYHDVSVIELDDSILSNCS